MRLKVDIQGSDLVPTLPGGGDALVAFMSFAVARGFGAQHPLIALADRLQQEHGIGLGPMTVFYESDIEDREDEEKLEMAWQPAPELLAVLDRIAIALASDAQAQLLVERANAQSLPEQIDALRAALRRPAEAAVPVRLSYSL